MSLTSLEVVPLSKELLETAVHRAHTYESFGRALAEQLVRSAGRQEIEGNEAKIPVEFTLRSSTTQDRGPVVRSGCIDVCAHIPVVDVDVCVHVEWE